MHRQASRQGNEPGTQRPAGAEWAGRRRGEPAMPALSYAHGVSDVPLLGETIGANLARTASRFPDREALVDMASGRRWTYQQLSAEVDALARALLALGVEKGERVGIWAPNVPEWMFVQYATARIGAILVNINPAYRTSELAYVLRQAGIRTLVAAERFKTSDYRAMVEQVRPECPALREVFFVGTPDWDALLATSSTVDSAAVAGREATLSFDDPINIQYTSGTTGFPKGATLSHHNILNNGLFIGAGCRYTHADRVCIPVPFYHCFGMVLGNLACTTHGACIVIPAPGFDPAATLRAVQAERCTRGYSVMLGYWNDEEQTRGAIDAARWMHTGDLAVMDDAGYLNIAGRIKDMVIRGGENVYPREVEEFLYSHPAIEDVQVIGVPDAKYGEELCAWVKLRPGAELSLEELREFCTGQIAHFKIPRYLRVTDEFPMTVPGKVQKYLMREV